MKDNKFYPQVGMRTEDCYLHGGTSDNHIGHIGLIEHVGVDYFILRDQMDQIPILIHSKNYWVIEQEDFK